MASRGQTFKFFLEGIADLDIKGIKSGVQQANKHLSNIKMPNDLKEGFNKQIKDILADVDKFQKKMEVGFHSEKEVQKAYQDYDKLLKQIERFQKETNKLSKGTGNLELISGDSIKRFREAKVAYDQVIKSTRDFDTAWTEATKNLTKPQKINFNVEELIKGAAAGKDLELTLGKNIDQIDSDLTKLRQIYENDEKARDKLLERVNNKEKLNVEERNNLRRLEAERSSQPGGSLQQQEEKIKQLEEERKAILALQTPYSVLIQKLQQFQFDGSTRSLEELQNIMQQLATQHGQELANTLDQVADGANRAKTAADSMKEPMTDLAKTGLDLAETGRQMGQLESRMVHFFSLANGWNLIRKAVRNAFTAIKDLDQEMTEIAVVTEMSLDQVWARRDMYVKTARELGAATLDVVAASKLYYQQGLSEAEVNTITTETIKMARIAHLDGARATDLMTAAIRGFNLEMSEASRINDVYSQLAAKSAADTEEIANAMTKTASIAYSAGASFENTASFLTQMIETTREASENLGTAMKTIIARFQEMKKAPSEIGEIDGEFVDANKFETALKTVGIALRDLRTGEFRNFDDVIMEISEKWDSMDQLTQRYIATTAAGSRQQSRFIALVSNHSRLLELTGLAADSAGASQEQFSKTLDSLESKLNQLKNGLELFYTTLMNSKVIKFAVDTLTKIINLVNNLTQKFGSLGGTVVGAITAFAAFKGGGAILTKAFQSMGSALGITAGGEVSKGLVKGIISGLDNKSIEKKLKSFFSADGLKKQFAELRASMQNLKPEEILRLDDMHKQFESLALAKKLDLNITDQLLLQMSEEELMNLNAIALHQAQITSTTGLTQEEAKLNFQKIVGNEVSAMRIKYQVTEVATTKTLGGATKDLINSIKIYIKSKLLKNTTDAAGNILTKEEIRDNVKQAASTWLKVAANYGYAASLFVIIAAVGVLIYAITDWIKTDKERMSQLQKNAELYENTIEKTKKSIEDLKQSHDDLKEKTDTFHDLTKGTVEWRQALIEVNNKVLEILTTYPKLAAFLEKGKYGELSLSDAGFEEAIRLQNKRLAGQQQGQLLNQMSMTELGFKITHGKALEDERVQIVQSFVALGHSVEDLKDVQSQAYKDLLQLYNDQNLDLGVGGSSFQIFRSELMSSQEDLINFSLAINSAEKELQGLGQAFVHSIAASDAELSEMVADELLQPLFEAASSFGKDVEEKRRKLEKETQFMADSTAWYTDPSGMIRESIRKEYAKLTGLTDAEVKQQLDKKEITYDLIAQELATIKVNEEYAKAIKDNIKILKDLGGESKKLQDSFVNVVRDGGVGASKQDLNSVLENLGLGYQEILSEGSKEIASKVLEQAEGSNKLIKLLNLDENDYEALYDYFNDLVTKREDLIASTRDQLAVKDRELFDELVKDLDSDRINKLSDRLKIVALNAGEQASSYLLELLSGMEQNLTSDKFKAVMDIVQATDFKDTSKIKEFGALLEDIGVGWNSDQIDGIIDDLINVNGAIYKLSFKELEDKIRNIGKIIRDIRSGEKATFSEDEYKKIIEESPELAINFTEDLDGNFHYLGDSMDRLTNILERLLEEQQRDLLKSQQEKVQVAQLAGSGRTYKYESYAEGGVQSFEINYEQAKDSGIEAQKGFLEGFLKEAENQNLDVSNLLGIDSNSLFSTDDETVISAAMNNIIDYVTNEFSNVADVKRLEENLSVLSLLQLDSLDILKKITEQDPAGLKKYSDALMIQGKAYKDLTKEVLILEKAQKSGVATEIKAAQTTLAQALALKKAEEKVKDYSEEIDFLVESLENINDADPKELFESLSFIFNDLLELDIGEEFLTNAENYDLFLQVLGGSQEAWEELIELLEKTKVSAEELAEEFNITSDVINGIINELDGKDFTVEGKADVSQLLEQLRIAGLATDQAIQLLEKLGNSKIVAEPKYEETVHPGTGIKWNRFVGYEYKFVEGSSTSRIQDSPFTSTRGGTSKGGGGSAKEDKPWENPYDWLYNLNQDINAAIREGNLLTKEREKVLKSSNRTEGQIKDAIAKENANLDKQLKLYEKLKAARQEELKMLIAQNAKFSEYAWFDEATQTVRINWEKVNAITDANLGALVEGFIKSLETVVGHILDAEDAIQGVFEAKESLSDVAEDLWSWENPLSWIYNMLKHINAEMRQINRIQWVREKMIKYDDYSAEDIFKSLELELNSIFRTIDMYDLEEKGAYFELDALDKQYAHLQEYMRFNRETGNLIIDWAKINNVDFVDTGEEILEAIEKYEEIEQILENVEDGMFDMIDNLEEILDFGKQQYLTLEKRLYDAVVGQSKKEIDRLKNISDSVTSSNSKLLKSLQQIIRNERDARKLDETLENIAKKERKLALLQMDVSGASALEILKLQEELDKDRQSYTDSLIDQAIKDLQEGNDVAAEQRSNQINLMERQLQYAQDQGLIWEHVEDMLQYAFATGNYDTIKQVIQEHENYQGMSMLEKSVFDQELNEQLKNADVFNRIVIASDMNSGFSAAVSAIGGFVSKVNSEISRLDSALAQQAADIAAKEAARQRAEAAAAAEQARQEAEKAKATPAPAPTPTSAPKTTPTPSPTPSPPKTPASTSTSSTPSPSKVVIKDTTGVTVVDGRTGNTILEHVSDVSGNLGKVVDNTKNTATNTKATAKNTTTGAGSKNPLAIPTVAMYSSGGKVETTGPAILHGSKKRPEAVLNPIQTQHFIEFKDMLGSILQGASYRPSSPPTSANNYYTFDIKVDQMANDYDVEKLVAKIKQSIASEAQYRNVQVASLQKY